MYYFNAGEAKEKVRQLVLCSVPIALVAGLFGGSLGFFESIAQKRPFLPTLLHSGMNAAVFGTATFVVRESLANARRKILGVSDEQSVSGADGAVAGALTGFYALRCIGGHGRSAYSGALWLAAIAGVSDALLTSAGKQQ